MEPFPEYLFVFSKIESLPKKEPMKPYILTRDVIQAKVMGQGYPSLPVYTIDEFYDQLTDKGYMPEDGCGGHGQPEGIFIFNYLRSIV